MNMYIEQLDLHYFVFDSYYTKHYYMVYLYLKMC